MFVLQVLYKGSKWQDAGEMASERAAVLEADHLRKTRKRVAGIRLLKDNRFYKAL